MTYFKNITTLEELKKAYKKLAFQHHPDRGGSLEAMQKVNVEYEELFKSLHKKDNKTGGNFENVKEYMDIINDFIQYEDITIDIVGNWIWITGNTFPIKDAIKERGFLYASKKKAWYLKPSDYVRTSRRHYSLDEIKSKYGFQTVTGDGVKGKPSLGTNK